MVKDEKDQKTPAWSATPRANPKSPSSHDDHDDHDDQLSVTSNLHNAHIEGRESRQEDFEYQLATPIDPFLGKQLTRLIAAQEETNRHHERRERDEQEDREKQRKDEKREQDQEYSENNIRYCEEFIRATMAVSTLGASGCFVTVVAQIQNPAFTNPNDHHERHDVRFHKETVRLFIALAWTCFIFALGLAVFASSILQAQRAKIHDSFKRKDKVLKYTSLMLTLFMEILQLGAFTCLGLVISAYRPYVGWFVVGLASTFLVIAFLFWNKRRRDVLEYDRVMEGRDEEEAVEDGGNPEREKGKAQNATAKVVNNVT